MPGNETSRPAGGSHAFPELPTADATAPLRCTFCGEPGITFVIPAPVAGTTEKVVRLDYCERCRDEYRLEGRSGRNRCARCSATGRHVNTDMGSSVYGCGAHYDDLKAEINQAHSDARDARVLDLKEQAGWRFADYTLATYPRDRLGRDTLELANEWVASGLDYEPPQNLFLHGDVGTGKTGLAFACSVSLIDDRDLGYATKIEWVAVRQLLAQVKASFNGGPPVDRDFSMETHLVVLDDLGAERCTEWTRDYLAAIIEDRYDHGAATLVTTNFAPSELAARLGYATDTRTLDLTIGERIVSRLIDGAVVIPFKGADRRKRAEQLRISEAA